MRPVRDPDVSSLSVPLKRPPRSARGAVSLRAAWRLVSSVVHALHGIAVCAFVFPFLAPAARMRRVAWWSVRMLEVFGIELRRVGTVPAAPVLLLANHVSWLDILAINAVQPARFVAKADMRRWPLLGFLIASGGTLFIERERKRDALRVVHQVAAALRDGATVAVFPEGTTGDGPSLLPFHANLLQAAISTATPVQSVALRFSDAASAFSAAAIYGEVSLLRSVWAVACADALQVNVTLPPLLASVGTERRALAQTVRQQIQCVLDAGAADAVRRAT
ncbi:MAG: lysophospholipid acyltransferase family protein [Caldimonas sp.]